MSELKTRCIAIFKNSAKVEGKTKRFMNCLVELLEEDLMDITSSVIKATMSSKDDMTIPDVWQDVKSMGVNCFKILGVEETTRNRMGIHKVLVTHGFIKKPLPSGRTIWAVTKVVACVVLAIGVGASVYWYGQDALALLARTRNETGKPELPKDTAAVLYCKREIERIKEEQVKGEAKRAEEQERRDKQRDAEFSAKLQELEREFNARLAQADAQVAKYKGLYEYWNSTLKDFVAENTGFVAEAVNNLSMTVDSAVHAAGEQVKSAASDLEAHAALARESHGVLSNRMTTIEEVSADIKIFREDLDQFNKVTSVVKSEIETDEFIRRDWKLMFGQVFFGLFGIGCVLRRFGFVVTLLYRGDPFLLAPSHDLRADAAIKSLQKEVLKIQRMGRAGCSGIHIPFPSVKQILAVAFVITAAHAYLQVVDFFNNITFAGTMRYVFSPVTNAWERYWSRGLDF